MLDEYADSNTGDIIVQLWGLARWPDCDCDSLSIGIGPYMSVSTTCRLHSGGAKVGPAGARAPAVKTCAPAVPRQLAGSLGGESRDSSSQPVDSNKSYLIIGSLQTYLSLTCLSLSGTIGVTVKVT